VTGVPQRAAIVGAGLAGDRCAFGLRQAGFDGTITLIGAEPVRPYDRPPLSKAVLKSVGAEDEIFYRSDAEYAAAGIDLMLGRTVVDASLREQSLKMSTGETLAYDALVIATGSRLREVDSLPRGMDGVFYLRDRSDALALRTALDTGGRVAVIGGGVIGLEAAAAAAARSLPVTVVEPAPRIMGRACGAIVASWLAERHHNAGVSIRCGVGLASVQRGDGAYRLALTDGSTVEAEIIIVGVGVVPETSLAEKLGLLVAPEGIVVDGHGRTSEPSVFAAGEVAFHFNARVSTHERQENWFHAAAHGEHVGRSIVEPGADYSELSGFWTDQYEVSLQSTGRALAGQDVIRGDMSDGRFVVFHLDGDVLVGASGVNSASELRQAKTLIRNGTRVDAAKLADPLIKIGAATLQEFDHDATDNA
jgi:NADPH-dependent 2,4-dienoyl-CoA reductase/sulfur reductase-like enzyme